MFHSEPLFTNWMFWISNKILSLEHSNKKEYSWNTIFVHTSCGLIFFDWQIDTVRSRVAPPPPVENIQPNVAWFEHHTFDILFSNDRVKDNTFN